MVNAYFTKPFLDDLARLSETVENAVWEKTELVIAFPGAGSSLVEPSLCTVFGSDCLKVNAAGYDILFDYDRAADSVYFLGIVPQRAVR